ncbi:regakine-1-like [Xyrichtys novacula]|uniref:Regakine-1-like n=1 Tax=Xyrichtys novacula TaxID=13765 RepID=A0AAV1GFZ8_XYRNO|nr:regakine-1-like [Xyrichtys novacula]
MRFSLVSVTLLCFTSWMSLTNATIGPVTVCCEQWSTTRIPVERVKNYTIQSGGGCTIKAIMFLTKKGKTLCSDPDDGWTKKAMRKVDEETKVLLQQPGQSEGSGSAGVITPALAPTSKKASQKKGRRRTRARGRKSGGRGKNRRTHV